MSLYEKTQTVLEYGKLALELAITLPFGAFSTSVRKEIGARDKWTCQHCGVKFKDGYMVQAAHFPELHDRALPWYDDPKAGRILCVKCHLHETLQMGDVYGARLLAQHAFKNGLHIWKYIEKHPDQLDQDRAEIVSILDQYGYSQQIKLDT